jgi:hypothetical protein
MRNLRGKLELIWKPYSSLFLMKADGDKKVALRNYRITKLKAKPKGHAVCVDLALSVHLLNSSFPYWHAEKYRLNY